MAQALGVLLGVLVAGSLVLIALYVLGATAAAVVTVVAAHRHRLLVDDLDRVLVEVLGPRTSAAGGSRGVGKRR